MFVKRHPANRLLSLAVSLILITFASLSVCPALAASATGPHRCCKPRSGPEPAPENNGCRTRCAAVSESAVTPVSLHIGFSSLEQTFLPHTAASVPRPRAAGTVTPAADTTATRRPIYERTSALLI